MFNVATESNEEAIECTELQHLKLIITDENGEVVSVLKDDVVPTGKKLEGSVIFKLRTIPDEEHIIHP